MATGPRYSDTDSGITKRAISDVVNMIDWTEAPLLRIFGFSDSNRSKFDIVNWPSTKVEWIEDTMSPSTTTLDEAIDGTETAWDVASGAGKYFRQGDIVGVYAAADLNTITEKVLVTSVSSDTLTVTLGYGSTSATTHDSGDTLKILSRAMPENASYTTGHTTTTTQPYNYTQILSQAVEVSRTAAKMSTYGIDDLMDYHVAKLFADGGAAGKLAQQLSNTFYFGERVVRASGTTYGSMGGFETFVTTNVKNKSGAAITRSDVHTKIREIRTAGGKVTHLITGAWGIEKLTSMYEGLITTARDEKLGGSEITSILTPHGKVKLVFDWQCPEDRYYFVNADKLGWIPFDEFSRSEVETQRDGYASDVVGEFTFLLANEKSHGYIYGASTTK